ncbi:MAG: septum formation initiator family protein [Actinomycetes bacterium]|jgi:cell division protein FtsB|nr:septum formation initiator family protein [Actinomycetes bacterium]
MAKGKEGKVTSLRLLLIPVVLVVLAVLIFAWYRPSLKIWYREARQERVLRATLVAIRDYNRGLEEEIASLETTAGVEDYARRELNLVEEGDHSIVVTRDGQILKAPNNSREAAVGDLPKSYKPFGAWTAFFDSLFNVGN